MAEYSHLYEGLDTLQPPDGTPPSSRMSNASQIRDLCVKAIRYDTNNRDYKRARLKGLIDGNPPYSKTALRAAGRSEECNVNWRIAKYFLGLARGMLYDVTTEAPTLSTITLDPYLIAKHARTKSYGIPPSSQADEWSHHITEEFEWLQRQDENHDWVNQEAQGQSVFYGNGPIHFADLLDYRPMWHESKSLLLPETARSNPNLWEWAAIVQEYSPDQLYARIANPGVASKVGWNVPEVRRSIMYAHPLTRTGVMYQSWSWHQDVLKNGSFYYADQSLRIRVVYFYFREFPEDGDENGPITEAIIELDGMGSKGDDGRPHENPAPADPRTKGGIPFLFWSPRRYKSWREVLHPLYWDHDLNGYHHSVNGLGLEMYGALEYLNRLYCRQADDAMAPNVFFKPTTASERQKLSIAQVGRYGILPAALELVQQHVIPQLSDRMAQAHEVQNLVSVNLSQFRSSAVTKQQGNPVTARQIDYEASEQARMGKTQLARIYEQYDWLYQEKYRRATNPSYPSAARGGKLVSEFVERCKSRGVPEWALPLTGTVRATRVVGQGSQFMRQQALEFLLGLVSMLPESGRQNLVRDVIASRAGQSLVDRYAPQPGALEASQLAQESEAMLQVSAMKTGIPPILVPTQNPAIFAPTFIQAAEGAAQSAGQGGYLHEAAAFLNIAIPAAAQHLQRMAMDPSREALSKQLGNRLSELGKAKRQIDAAVADRMQQQQEAAAASQGPPPEVMVEAAKVQGKLQLDAAKMQASHGLKVEKQRGDFALRAEKQKNDLALAARKLQTDAAMEAGRLSLDARKAALEHQLKTAVAANDAHVARMKAAKGPSNGSSSK